MLRCVVGIVAIGLDTVTLSSTDYFQNRDPVLENLEFVLSNEAG